jgi:hypothetical protein
MKLAILLVIALAATAVMGQAPAAPIHHAANFGGSSATTCNPGEGVVSADPHSPVNSCAKCLAGYYQSGTGTLACTACPAGSWSPVGSAACYQCPAGTISGVAADGCDECGFGTVAASTYYTLVNRGKGSGTSLGNTRCYPCDVNFYQPQAGQTDCLPCPANTNTAGAQGAGACFAATGGNTVAGTKAGAAAPALVEIHQPAGAATHNGKVLPKGVASGSSNDGSAHVKPASAGPKPIIRPSKRGNYKHSAAAKPAAAKKPRFAALQP